MPFELRDRRSGRTGQLDVAHRPTTHLQRFGVDQQVNHFPGQPRCVSERSLWNILEHIDIEQETYTSCMPCLTLDNPAVRLEQFGTIIVIHPLVPDTIFHRV